MTERRMLHLGRVAGLASVYIIVARLGLLLEPVSGFASLVWPATGIALAALLLYGRELWPGVAIGAFVVNLSVGGPLAAALGIGLGNTLEAVIGEFMLRRVLGLRAQFERLRHAIGLLVFAALGSAVSATIGVTSLHLAGALRAGFRETWLAWWLGDAIAAIIVTPLLLSWIDEPRRRITLPRAFEAVALGGALLGVTAYVFLATGDPAGSGLRRPYLGFPVIFLIALRYGMRGATAAMFATAVFAISATASSRGPFVRPGLVESLMGLQAYLAIAGATALLIGTTISEWERAVRGRDDLLAVVSHDLKNPLGAIQLSTAALERAARPDDARLHRHVELVQRSAERMNAIIRDLLDAAALDVGRLSLCMREEDAEALLDEALTLATPTASQKRQVMAVERRRRPIPVVCDRERVIRVLMNLICNAIKYTPEGGSVRVSVVPWERAVCFSVTDTGIGMSQEALRRIFEPYFRVSPRSGEGSGLGLFIAREIVDAHGGRIWVESTAGVGSSFHFTLPLTRKGSRNGALPRS